jgi:hypothetical protein
MPQSGIALQIPYQPWVSTMYFSERVEIFICGSPFCYSEIFLSGKGLSGKLTELQRTVDFLQVLISGKAFTSQSDKIKPALWRQNIDFIHNFLNNERL